ncbi:Cys-tRNA(Pro) deacylase [Sinanaerobacter chloroacetimidivorans]|jgi:Cys-tRNA(Pro)/Cys-tRNA(Cys) deacylase|uniref:Cys-tRNA(Pro)/Cys-tRNA(Cys) deacylase n=1 Tax=Sinanaerobacter chloroacetimidivorans TaxID=2818044 RepID=A0A8J7W3K7_9FIRM|nr:Cys-tRNA(Pro) deacylase [Sinanaerobacter chloroacetimidivorans]MBR0598295.1 Cys-tRNA(Pro) deacylase [Sinanaerobacter chloroacetimidivorans]
MSSVKTNAVRLLDAKKIIYRVYEYDAPDGFLDGVSVAKATGMDPKRVFKTLVTQGSGKENYVCVIPVEKELNLKAAAKHFGEKKIEMIPAKDITKITGYIKGGCSPVGMKKLFPTVIDKSAQDLDAIVVSGGKVGLQMELSVPDLLRMVNGSLADITVSIGES